MRAPIPAPTRMSLQVGTAAELMSENPISIRQDATVHEALTVMLDRDVTAAPVIDESGRAVGVVSVTDVLIHQRVVTAPAGIRAEFATARIDATLREAADSDLLDPTQVIEIMTPTIFTVGPDHPAEEVVAELLRLNVHRLFVTDPQGVIVGVITTTDIVRRLGR